MTYREKITKDHPLRFHGQEKADVRCYDGALRHARGVQSYQIVRACRNHPEQQEGFGWTYNHAANLCWWNGKFFYEYLSNEIGEHQGRSHTLLCTSEDGIHWDKPMVIFPEYWITAEHYQGPNKQLLPSPPEKFCACMHQRCGFYVTKSGKLLVTGFYGVCPEPHTSPNNGWGIGRVVREIYPDMTFSPIYFAAYNTAAGYRRDNTDGFPYFDESGSPDFIAACEEMLADRVYVQQWWEEQRFDPQLFTQHGGSALCTYTDIDGKTIGVYKHAMCSITEDNGENWTKPVRCASIETSTGKVWGQRTSDGRYALCYNPHTDSMHRWPIAAVTGDNGHDFDNMLAVTTEVPPCRYAGYAKNLGPQYMRGIVEGFPQSPDGAVWLAYSVNKEDMWISKIPVPITGTQDEDICEDFSGLTPGGEITGWNIYSPIWAPVSVQSDNDKNMIVLEDTDPYDRAKAERSIPEAQAGSFSVQLRIDAIGSGNRPLRVELQDRKGAVPFYFAFGDDHILRAKSGGVLVELCGYETGLWYDLTVSYNCVLNRYTAAVSREGSVVCSKELPFAQSTYSAERVLFATKECVNHQDLEANGKDLSLGDLPDSDTRLSLSRMSIAFFSCTTEAGKEESEC